MKNLTKENFWNKISKDYPKAFKHFSEWIDVYKIENNWKNIFNPQFWENPEQHRIYSTPKYHDLPTAIQFGIFIQFIYEVDTSSRYLVLHGWVGKEFYKDINELVLWAFNYLEKELK